MISKKNLDLRNYQPLPYLAPTLERLDITKYSELVLKLSNSLSKFRTDFAQTLQAIQQYLPESNEGDQMDLDVPSLQVV